MEISDAFLIVLLQILTLFALALVTVFFWVQNERTKIDMQGTSVELEKKLQTLPGRLNKSMKHAIENIDFEELIPELIPDQPASFWTSLVQALPYLIQAGGLGENIKEMAGGALEGLGQAGAQVIAEEVAKPDKKESI